MKFVKETGYECSKILWINSVVDGTQDLQVYVMSFKFIESTIQEFPKDT